MQAEHEWPKPLWKKNADGSVSNRHANSAKEMRALTSPLGSETSDEGPDMRGWSREYIHHEFPMALYAHGGATILVRNQAQMDKALENGWSLKPETEEVEHEEAVTLTHETVAPKKLKEQKKPKKDKGED